MLLCLKSLEYLHKRLKQRQKPTHDNSPCSDYVLTFYGKFKIDFDWMLKNCFESVLFTVSETIVNTMTYLALTILFIFSDRNRFTKLSKVKLVNRK